MVELAGGGRASLKRFYKESTVGSLDGGLYGVLLDGRPAKTPKRAVIAAPTRLLAAAIADEWAGAGENIIVSDLRLTRLAATAIDLGAEQAGAWRDDLARYASSDLLCYRASGPDALRRRQRELWDPYVDWARSALGAPFVTTEGVVAIAQPRVAIDAIRRAAGTLDSWRLIAVKTASEIAGSAILALALERRAFAADAIFEAAQLDETYQAAIWGRDSEAEARAARLKYDFDAAAVFLRLLAL